MRIKTAFSILTLLTAGFLNTDASAMKKVEVPGLSENELSSERTTLNAHLEAVDSYQAQKSEIQKKIESQESRIAQLNEKPHMDPKGFQRLSAKLLSGHLKSRMKEIDERIAWHREQISQLQGAS